jgi:hypothetical protein
MCTSLQILLFHQRVVGGTSSKHVLLDNFVMIVRQSLRLTTAREKPNNQDPSGVEQIEKYFAQWDPRATESEHVYSCMH